MGRLIDVNKISSSIAGAVTSGVFNFILNKIVPNISIFLSVGGFILFCVPHLLI